MTQRVVLVTGASSGLGKATAELLASKGYYVYAAARRIDRLESMRSTNIEPLGLDVTSEASIEVAIEHIKASQERIDVLVNAAGYALYGALEEVASEKAQHEFEVNVFGLMRVTQALLPLMRQQRSGRIINLSSVAGKFVTPFAGWYNASKFAVEALSDALRNEVASFGIQVVVVEPGAIKSEFADIALGGLQDASNLAEYRGMSRSFAKLVSNSYRNAPGPDIVAKAIFKAITARHPSARYALPADSSLLITLRRLLSDRMIDSLLRSQIKG